MVAAAAAVLAYVGSLQFDFVWDDRILILGNPWMQSWHYLPQYFSRHLFAGTRPTAVGFFWRPLFVVWLRLNYSLWGPHPAPWHAVTIAVHAAACALLFVLARRLSGSAATGLVAALIFAVHPATIETAAWVSGMPDSVCAILLMGSLLLYAGARQRSSPARYAATVALYAMALLVKETAIVFPVLLVAYEIFFVPPGTEPRPRNAVIATTAAITVVYFFARHAALSSFAHPANAATVVDAVLTAPALLLSYLRLLPAPWPISPHYGLALAGGAGLRVFWLPLLGLLAIAALAAVWWVRAGVSARAQTARFALAWMAAFLVLSLYAPAILGSDFLHVRYLYLPAVGFALLLGSAIPLLPRATSLAVGAAVLLALIVLNVTQQGYWANDLVLSARGAAVAPRNVPALAEYGVQLGIRGERDRALQVLRQAATLDPHYWYAVASLGYTEYSLGLWADAEGHFKSSIPLLPEPVEQYLYLGIAAARLGKMDEAEWALREAIRRQPQAPRYHMALALVLEQEGKPEEAAQAAREEVQIDPAAQDARELLARVSPASK
ncbi:MAG TPA: tetratricopeptide repeat protein [Terriglobales bacterium]|nr:tetratricopeptide repeat protein [Terriglobales bacterium]